MTTVPYKRRNLGLDVIRSVAILLVLLDHMRLYFIAGNSPGVWGVEVFFVLSGYLIGQIILRTFQESFTFDKVKEFWIRRWFRTLPMYFAVLLVLDFILDKSGEFHWSYYLFLQNFNDSIGFFSVSWSLTIEEWFYLLLPLLFLIVRPHKATRGQMLGFLGSVLVIITIARAAYVLSADPNFDMGIRKFVPIRLDALMVGVLLAHVKLSFPDVHKKMARLPVFLGGMAVLAGVALYFYKYPGIVM
ncbi:MAG: acyltransferase, partial [Bacteroidota bacterium]